MGVRNSVEAEDMRTAAAQQEKKYVPPYGGIHTYTNAESTYYVFPNTESKSPELT